MEGYRFSKRIVVFCISFIVTYTIVQTILSYLIGLELSPTLTTAVYAFFGTELVSVAAIKIFEERTAKKESEDSDRDSEVGIPDESASE